VLLDTDTPVHRHTDTPTRRHTDTPTHQHAVTCISQAAAVTRMIYQVSHLIAYLQ